MSSQPGQPQQPTLHLLENENYREGYANSVQVRISIWDFFLNFGTMTQNSPDEVLLKNFQGVYMSPQQAKALFNLLGHNLQQYEQAFGQIALEPLPAVRDGSVN